MKIFSLYRDFFTFLEKISPGSLKWDVYCTHYFKPHQEFLDTYFSHFPLIDFSNLRQRVEAIKSSDYSWLEHLISASPPEEIVRDAYEKCCKIITGQKKPEVYLFVGFFSPDGFVMKFKEKPVICFGLERFMDFRLLKIIFSHEYAHFLLHLSKGKVPEEKEGKWLIISEGLATYFSFLAFPERKREEHFLMNRFTLIWCQQHESLLRDIYSSGKYSSQELTDFYLKGNPALNLPPRAGKYLGFQAVEKFLAQNSEMDISLLLSDRELALSLEL